MKTRKGLETYKIYIFKVLKQDHRKKKAKKSVETYKIYIFMQDHDPMVAPLVHARSIISKSNKHI
jgi:hypothetical protein